MADIFPEDVHMTDAPPLAQPTTKNTFNVPSSWLKPLNDRLISHNQTHRSKHAMGIDLTKIYPTLIYNITNHNKTYYRLTNAVKFLSAGYDSITCAHPNCHTPAKILNHELKPIKSSRQARKLYDPTQEQHVVFLETTCNHANWDREMVWAMRKVSFDDSVVVKTVERWIENESDESD